MEKRSEEEGGAEDDDRDGLRPGPTPGESTERSAEEWALGQRSQGTRDEEYRAVEARLAAEGWVEGDITGSSWRSSTLSWAQTGVLNWRLEEGARDAEDSTEEVEGGPTPEEEGESPAGDLSDPHGTHRTCLAAVRRAIERVRDRPWFADCELWLYRGAWQEWAPHEIEMAVPFTHRK